MLRLLLVWTVAGALACGQSMTGTLTGIARDPQNAAVPAAKVVARNLDTGAKTSAETDAEGWFRLLNLPPGDYSIEITAPGFRTMTIATGRLGAAEVVRVDADTVVQNQYPTRVEAPPRLVVM